MAVKIYLSQNNNTYSSAYGKYYAYADNETPITLEGLADHMAHHNTPFSKGTIVGILKDMVSCIRELNLNGQPVKIDGLAIFSTHVENHNGWKKLEDVNLTIGSTDEQGKPVGIQALRLCAQATGEFTKAELTKYGTVLLNREWRKKVQEAKKAAWAKKNGDVWGKKNHRPKKVQWYNKNRYVGYGRLIRRLTAGMSDAELQRIRGILQRAKADFAANS